MKRSQCVLLALLFALSATAQEEKEGKWVALFNGKDLSGWKKYGTEKWVVENGEILGEAVTKAYGYLGTERTYRNFEMKGCSRLKAVGTAAFFTIPLLRVPISKGFRLRWTQVLVSIPAVYMNRAGGVGSSNPMQPERMLSR